MELVLIFSKDRAMQLHATIESLCLHCTDFERAVTSVLYKVTDDRHARQYDMLQEAFSDVSFVQEVDFRAQVLDIIANFSHVLFLVDDNLFARDFHFLRTIGHLEQLPEAVGFSLRLGFNTEYCYAHNAAQPLPSFISVSDGVLQFDWTSAKYDFGYPLELSSSVYRVSDMLELFSTFAFDNPNTLEAGMAARAESYAASKPRLLCFERSVTFCNPVNVVQSAFANRAGRNVAYTADCLADAFDRGRRINVERYAGFTPNACHQEVELHFKNNLVFHPGATVHMQEDNSADSRPYNRDRPLFSVVMANYNNGRYIGQAIESVLNQTFEAWELIVVDDGSSDDSPAVVERYANDPRIRLIRHASNCGYTAGLKTGIAHVRSDIFGILDSDDVLRPRALDIMYKAHVERPQCGLIYSQFAYCDADMRVGRPGFCGELAEGSSAMDANVVSHFKTFKLADYRKSSGYDEHIKYAEDVDIVYKMEEVTKLHFVNECLYLYRELPESICHDSSKISIAIMSRVKARINALKRRAATRAARQGRDFDELFSAAVAEAKAEHTDVAQYFTLLEDMYSKGLFDGLQLPDWPDDQSDEDRLLWIAANVDVDFERFGRDRKGHDSDQAGPLISVYMVTYNCRRFIGEAIESVLAQTYRNIELLVVDDGSTDDTADLVKAHTDSRIRYIPKEHKNFASGMNEAIRQARGEFLLGVDADDFIAADYIERMAAVAAGQPDVDYFYPAHLMLVDEHGRNAGGQWEYADFSDNRLLPAFIFANGFGPVPNPGSLKRRSLFDRVGLYEEVETVEDFLFLCRNALKIRFKRIDSCSAYFYRRLESGNSRKFEARDRLMAEALNDMVSIYPAAVLCSDLEGEEGSDVFMRRYYAFVCETFRRHAQNGVVRHPDQYLAYARLYEQKARDAADASNGSYLLLSDSTRIRPVMRSDCQDIDKRLPPAQLSHAESRR